MSFLKNIIQKIVNLFKSSGAALTTAANLVGVVLPVVEEIAALAPNRTDEEIAAVFQKFGVPLSQQILSTPLAQRGYVLLELATEVLAARFPSIATSILYLAVQLAMASTGSITSTGTAAA